MIYDYNYTHPGSTRRSFTRGASREEVHDLVDELLHLRHLKKEKL